MKVAVEKRRLGLVEGEVYHQSSHVPVDHPSPEEPFAAFADSSSIVDSC